MIFLHKNNLVGGPQNLRVDDPGNELDKPILTKQSTGYQKASNQAYYARPNKFLARFMEIPKPDPVSWGRSRVNNNGKQTFKVVN